MKHLLLAFVLTIAAIATSNAQEIISMRYDTWYIDLEVDEDRDIRAYSSPGELIKGDLDDFNGDITFWMNYVGQEANYLPKLTNLPWSYDDTEADANYITIKTILNDDKTTVKEYEVRISDENGNGYINETDGLNTHLDFITDLKMGGHIHIELHGAYVVKYDLSGINGIIGKGMEVLKEYELNNVVETVIVNNPFGGDEIQIVDARLEKYLESYIEIAGNVGLDLNYIYDKSIKISFMKIGKGNDTLGIANGMDNDDEVNIVIDTLAWEGLNELERTTTMYHELSHDILNAEHVEDVDHLMHPSYQYDSITSLVLGLTSIFKEHNN